MQHLFPLVLVLLLATGADAQTDTAALHFSLSGYAEPYYGYDFNRPSDGYRPGFVYAHNRHHEFNVNIAFLRASMQAQRF